MTGSVQSSTIEELAAVLISYAPTLGRTILPVRARNRRQVRARRQTGSADDVSGNRGNLTAKKHPLRDELMESNEVGEEEFSIGLGKNGTVAIVHRRNPPRTRDRERARCHVGQKLFYVHVDPVCLYDSTQRESGQPRPGFGDNGEREITASRISIPRLLPSSPPDLIRERSTPGPGSSPAMGKNGSSQTAFGRVGFPNRKKKGHFFQWREKKFFFVRR